jgi:hypothetical protein
MVWSATIFQPLIQGINEALMFHISSVEGVEEEMIQICQLLERLEDPELFTFGHGPPIPDIDIHPFNRVKYAKTFQCDDTALEFLSDEADTFLIKEQSAEYVWRCVRTTFLARETEVDEGLVVLTFVTWTPVDHLTNTAEDLRRKVLKSGRHLGLQDCNLARTMVWRTS